MKRKKKVIEPVPVTAVHLMINGSTSQVSLEINGEWITVIDTHTGTVSHIAEALGIRRCIEKAATAPELP